MSTSNSSNDITNTTPLLYTAEDNQVRRPTRRNSLRDAARFIRRASSRRLMREPSMLVRETAAEQLEERQSDWAYSKPVVILDILWNFAFVAVAMVVLVVSRNEKPEKPLRVWVLGYALQCVIHGVCVCAEYQQRRGRWRLGEEGLGSGERLILEPSGNTTRYVSLAQLTEEGTSALAKNLESANTMFSFIWWVIGFYWVSAGGQALTQDSPQLYWLCVTLLAFDVFFIVFCVVLACIIGIAVCCCLPCIIAFLYAVAEKEGATKEDVEQLSKYKFRRIGGIEKPNGEIQEPSRGVMTECGTDSPIEHVLSQENSDCCICLSAYDDGTELRELPCGHHFHCTCVDKWLYINATCPLCKYNILKRSDGGSEV